MVSDGSINYSGREPVFIKVTTGIGFTLLILLVLWLPIPWASTSPWAIYVFEIGVGVVFLFLSPKLLTNKPYHLLLSKKIRFILVVLFLWAFYLFLQTLPIPLNLLQHLSPYSYALYVNAAEQGISVPNGHLSVSVSTTLNELWLRISYIVLFINVLIAIDSEKKLKAFTTILLIWGVMHTVVALTAHYNGIWLVPVTSLDGHFQRVTGTFIGGNNFASYLTMIVGLALGLILARHGANDRYKLTTLLSWKKLAAIIAVIVLLVGVVSSGSRGAILSLIMAMGLFVLISTKRILRSMVRITIVMAVFVLVLGAIFLVTDTMLEERISHGQLSLGERPQQWWISSELFLASPIFGTGAGSYYFVFPSVRDGSLRPFTYNHAHSDFFQTVIEQGLLGLLMMGASILLILRAIFSTNIDPKYGKNYKWVTYGSGIAVLTMVVSAIYEINFRIPANAATFYVIAGIGIAASVMNSNRQSSRVRTNRI